MHVMILNCKLKNGLNVKVYVTYHNKKKSELEQKMHRALGNCGTIRKKCRNPVIEVSQRGKKENRS